MLSGREGQPGYKHRPDIAVDSLENVVALFEWPPKSAHAPIENYIFGSGIWL